MKDPITGHYLAQASTSIEIEAPPAAAVTFRRAAFVQYNKDGKALGYMPQVDILTITHAGATITLRTTGDKILPTCNNGSTPFLPVVIDIHTGKTL